MHRQKFMDNFFDGFAKRGPEIYQQLTLGGWGCAQWGAHRASFSLPPSSALASLPLLTKSAHSDFKHFFVSRHWTTLTGRGGAYFVGYCKNFSLLFCRSPTDAPVKSYEHSFWWTLWPIAWSRGNSREKNHNNFFQEKIFNFKRNGRLLSMMANN